MNKRKGTKSWISRESWKVEEERKQIKLQLINSKSERLKRSLRNKYYIKDREVKRSMRNDRRKWTEDMITDAERERERELPVMECEEMRGEAHQQQ